MSAPPRSPTNLTTSRNRALDAGTARSGFPDQADFDHAAGTPVGWPGSGGTYAETVTSTEPAPAAPNPKSIK